MALLHKTQVTAGVEHRTQSHRIWRFASMLHAFEILYCMLSLTLISVLQEKTSWHGSRLCNFVTTPHVAYMLTRSDHPPAWYYIAASPVVTLHYDPINYFWPLLGEPHTFKHTRRGHCICRSTLTLHAFKLLQSLFPLPCCACPVINVSRDEILQREINKHAVLFWQRTTLGIYVNKSLAQYNIIVQQILSCKFCHEIELWSRMPRAPQAFKMQASIIVFG